MKKIIDENGRLFGKISVIDLLVILIVIVIGAGLYVKFNVLGATSKSADKGTITYTVTVSSVRDYTANALKLGDTVYDKKNSGGYSIGTITNIAIKDAKRASETVDGKIVLGNYVGYRDITITLTANGALSAGRYLVNRTYELNANSIRTFNTKFCTFEATITEIK